jgi:hypothetical protein
MRTLVFEGKPVEKLVIRPDADGIHDITADIPESRRGTFNMQGWKRTKEREQREPLHKDAKGNRGLYKAEVQGGKCSYRLLDNHQARTLTKIAPPTGV